MSEQTLIEQEEQPATAPAAVSAAVAAVIDSQPKDTVPPKSELKPAMNAAYRLHLAGMKVKDIAKQLNISRISVWRYVKAVEAEAREQLENEPHFNSLVRQLLSLEDLEQQAREAAANATSDKAKAAFLGEARRASTAAANLKLATGLIAKEPEKHFHVTASLRPESPHDAKPNRTRDELVEHLLELLQNTPQLMR